MPARGVDLIDGIPVILKSGSILAFKPEGGLELKLGSYDANKKGTWSSSQLDTWLQTYRQTLAMRSRK
jgi:hypothetical protein